MYIQPKTFVHTDCSSHHTSTTGAIVCMLVYVLAHIAVMILACRVRMKPLRRLENSVIFITF